MWRTLPPPQLHTEFWDLVFLWEWLVYSLMTSLSTLNLWVWIPAHCCFNVPAAGEVKWVPDARRFRPISSSRTGSELCCEVLLQVPTVLFFFRSSLMDSLCCWLFRTLLVHASSSPPCSRPCAPSCSSSSSFPTSPFTSHDGGTVDFGTCRSPPPVLV